jgi:hypothetical protein
MTITLYKYLGEKNRVDKSGHLQTVLTTTGSFKKDTSVLSPTLLLALPTENFDYVTDENGNLIADVMASTEHDSVLDFNYMYIAEFRRYYYVTSIYVSSDLLLVVTGEVDPLYSFKDAILDNKAMIERNEFTYDVMQEDTLLPLEIEKTVDENDVTNLSEKNLNFKAYFTGGDPNAKNIVVTNAHFVGHGVTIPAQDNLPAIETDHFNDATGSISTALYLADLHALAMKLMGEESAYSTFFKGVVAFPFDVMVDHVSIGDQIALWKYDDVNKDWQVENTGIYGAGMPCVSSRLIVADFNLPSASSFLDMVPYSHHEIYIPFFGWYELQYNELNGHRLQVIYSVNYEDGSGEVYLYDRTYGRIIFTATVQIGVPLSLTSTNAEELGAQKRAMSLNLALSLVGSAAGLIGSAVTGNAIGVVGSGIAGVSAVTNYINQKSMMFERAQSSHNGAAGALYGPLTVRYRVTSVQARSGLNMSDYAHQYGRPLRDVRKLSTLTGFTQVSKVHLEGFGAFDAEKQEIESSLLAGVIL